MKHKHSFGFTIVELLIVIVVIGILAAITVVAYNGIQERTKITSATSDMRNLYQAIIMARQNTGKTLLGVTGNNCTRCATTASFAVTIDKISAASGMNLSDIKDGDPWGNEYFIDENEGESSASPCTLDGFSVVGQPIITANNQFLIPYSLPGC